MVTPATVKPVISGCDLMSCASGSYGKGKEQGEMARMYLWRLKNSYYTKLKKKKKKDFYKQYIQILNPKLKFFKLSAHKCHFAWCILKHSFKQLAFWSHCLECLFFSLKSTDIHQNSRIKKNSCLNNRHPYFLMSELFSSPTTAL